MLTGTIHHMSHKQQRYMPYSQNTVKIEQKSNTLPSTQNSPITSTSQYNTLYLAHNAQ